MAEEVVEEDMDHTVPADLLELYEVIEWNTAVEAQEGT